MFRPVIVVLMSCSFAALVSAQTSRPAPVANSKFVPAGYELVFDDEMNDPKLDITKWWTRYIYNDGKLDTLNDERQLFREQDNHVMTGSTLELTAYYDPNLKPPRFLYRSGMIRSKMTFKYGYFESRVKMPRGKGVWPAFWMNSDKRESDGKISWPPEIDIFEYVFNEKDDKANMFHVGVVARKSGDKPGSDIWGGQRLASHPKLNKAGHFFADYNIADEYHTWGCLWDTDDTVALFLDGEQIVKWNYKWVYADGTEAGYAHVLLNLAIGGQWAGRYGVDDKAFPQSLSVDYVRVYQKPDAKNTRISTVGHDLLDKPTTQPSTQPAK